MDDLNLADFDLGDGESLEADNLAADLAEDDSVMDATVEDMEEDSSDGLETVTKSNSSQLSIEREEFNKFINCVKLIVESDCTDCDIVDGVIRQLANNRRSIIKVNLSGILGDVNLPISNAVQKVALLKTFELDDTMEDEGGVDIEVEDKKIRFQDSYGHVSFNKPLRKMLDNKFMEDEEFDKKIEIADDKMILECTIPNYLAKRRIKSICDVVKTDVITVKIKKNKASIDIVTPDIKSTVVKNLDLVEGSKLSDCSFEMLLLPFAMDVSSDIMFKVYQLSKKKLLCTFDLNYLKVPVSIYMITQVN